MSRTKIEKVDERLIGLTVGKLQADVTLRRTVESMMEEIDHQLVMPPDKPKEGDQYLGDGQRWVPVKEQTYADPSKSFGQSSYIVRRPTEHLEMLWFFFGKNNEKAFNACVYHFHIFCIAR